MNRISTSPLSLQRQRKRYPFPERLQDDFQLFVIDWHNEDVEPEEDEEDSDDSQMRRWKPYEGQFLIKAFGTDREGNSIAVDITGFQPYFFIKVPDNWNTNVATIFMETLKGKVSKTFRNSLTKWSLIKGKPFYYFTGDERYKFKYIKLVFSSYTGSRKYEYLLREPIQIPGINQSKPFLYQLHESNILPTLRFIHERGLNASGWISLPRGRYNSTPNETTCQLQLTVPYQHVNKLESDDMPLINYLSYDIEADSSHGDFPIANKDYQKLARDIVVEFNQLQDARNQQQIALVRGRDLNGLRQVPEIRPTIERLINLAFNPYYNNNLIRSVKPYEPLDPNWLEPQFKQDLAQAILDIWRDSAEDAHDQLLELMAMNLPELDLEDEMDYQSLADQFVKELNRLKRTNNLMFQNQPVEVVCLLLELALDPHYDNNNVNVVYPVPGSRLPSKTKIHNMIPSVLKICERCFKHADNERRYGRKKLKQGQKRVTQDMFVEELTSLFNQHFPPLQGDPVIQIGSVLKRYGEQHPFLKHIITLKGCTPIQNSTLIADEHNGVDLSHQEIAKELVGLRAIETLREQELARFMEIELEVLVKMAEKAELRIGHEAGEEVLAQALTDRQSDQDLIDAAVKAETKRLKGLDRETWQTFNRQALDLRYQRQINEDQAQVVVEQYETEAEVIKAWVDLVRAADPDLIIGYNIFGFDYKYLFHRAQVLGISNYFHKLGRIDWFQGRGGNRDETVLKEQKLSSAGLGDNTLYYLFMFGRVSIDMYKVMQKSASLDSYKLDFVCKKYLSKSKNDVPPSEIFIKQKGNDDDRRLIAEYCLIDCVLVTRLLDKLEIIVNNIGMSNVCSVPFSYLFLRGQGIKLLSFVSKICQEKGYLIPVLKKPDEQLDNDESYEGAIVLNAHQDIYFEPVVVADFNSLYPSCMISENLSHDSYVGFKVVEKGQSTDLRGQPMNPDNQFETMLLEGRFEGWDYVDIVYDMYEYVPVARGRKKLKKVVKAHKVCRFAQPPNGQKSIIPTILKELLSARKNTRKDQKKYPKGSFKWNILEGQQLAYKVTANSLYGQIGARVGPLFLMDIAACTTATGRQLIQFSKKFCEDNYPGTKVVYGDTDSIFVKFAPKDRYGNKLVGLDAIYKSIEMCIEAATGISRQLKPPHNLEFEKAIWPFILVSKKRYHGHYYTKHGLNSYAAKSMGIVLKRRDNAPIVKQVFGGMTEIIMNKHDVQAAIEFIKEDCRKLLDGKYDMKRFIITKTLRSYYKNPDQIAHNVLAQRIGKRDPGNKPQGNDRIPYAYIRVKNEKCLQGDRIETPEFITQNDLKIDYRFYLTNQIIKPVSQILELVIKDPSQVFKQVILDYDGKLQGVQKITNPKFARFMKPIKLRAVSAKQLHLEYLDEESKRKRLEEQGEFADDYIDIESESESESEGEGDL